MLLNKLYGYFYCMTEITTVFNVDTMAPDPESDGFLVEGFLYTTNHEIVHAPNRQDIFQVSAVFTVALISQLIIEQNDYVKISAGDINLKPVDGNTDYQEWFHDLNMLQVIFNCILPA